MNGDHRSGPDRRKTALIAAVVVLLVVMVSLHLTGAVGAGSHP